jgi:hypothetical protein
LVYYNQIHRMDPARTVFVHKITYINQNMHDMKETKSVVVYFYGSLRLSSVSPANPDENRQEPASTLSLFTGDQTVAIKAQEL